MTLLSAIIVLTLIMDPVGNAPVFLNVLARVPEERRRWIILREMLIALGILVLFLFLGRQILTAMDISSPALSIAGGVVLFLISLRMIFPRRGESLVGDIEGEEPFIVPLAVPLIAGPSALTMLVLFATREPERLWTWLVALLVAWAVTATVLLLSDQLRRLLKERGERALVRLMGMILVTMSVQMLLNGIGEFLHQVNGG
ncbi:MarC family protein [Magnetospira thiophila]